MRPFRFALLASACVVFAACNDGLVAPDGPSIARSPSPFFTAGSASEPDSVYTGYGCESTGGIEYECFEYEPCTGTEYVVCPDTTTAPPPPPPPAPKPTSPTPTQSSMISGYGSGSTGSIEYRPFEYEPDTGTEPAVAFDGKGNDAP